ncbi:MAG: PilW family protein [Gallionella sp.]|nr:PilW family protein [Gallionella sp.]
MKPSNSRSLFRQAGFTLVEIMVGLVIGMLATVVIMQVFSVFEGQKRTTTGTADAQTNGGIALYNIGRELQIAGYPLLPAVNSPLECTTLNVNGVADATVPNRLTPAAITNGTSDTITIRYGDSLMGGVPTQFTTPATVSNNFGCQTGDIAIAVSADGLTCNMTSVTAASSATPTAITLANAVTGAELACLGAWNEITYAVNNGNLQRSGQDSVAGIVNLQAQYGISAAANSNQVTRWVNAKNLADWVVAVDGAATGVDWGNTMTVANRNRIKAIRIAVVARNAKMEGTAVTDACTTAKGTVNQGPCAWDDSNVDAAPAIDLSADANWQRYRYRVFETIIPLRNVIWSRDTL